MLLYTYTDTQTNILYIYIYNVITKKKYQSFNSSE